MKTPSPPCLARFRAAGSRSTLRWQMARSASSGVWMGEIMVSSGRARWPHVGGVAGLQGAGLAAVVLGEREGDEVVGLAGEQRRRWRWGRPGPCVRGRRGCRRGRRDVAEGGEVDAVGRLARWGLASDFGRGDENGLGELCHDACAFCHKTVFYLYDADFQYGRGCGDESIWRWPYIFGIPVGEMGRWFAMKADGDGGGVCRVLCRDVLRDLRDHDLEYRDAWGGGLCDELSAGGVSDWRWGVGVGVLHAGDDVGAAGLAEGLEVYQAGLTIATLRRSLWSLQLGRCGWRSSGC